MTWEEKLKLAADLGGVTLSAVECEMLLRYLESLKVNRG